ncbi:hypothetical protein [Paracoccus rhizosphaerae]|uniref:Uncharacterized protein n=1 Tax=Paracoccus rhizosphaerae TaxID=1133347 RepID=A0ABV6CIF2_9RHOB|nr:hypothetical protein [Paracoccus rhizosphaerae]
MITRGAIAWFIICLIAAVCAGVSAWMNPEKFSGVVSLLATIISILVGVSLAVIAVLNSPFSVSEKVAGNDGEAGRMTRVIRQDEDTLAGGQLIFFWIYFGALALSLLFNWMSSGKGVVYDTYIMRALASATASVGIFAFLWSTRLPLMLKQISSQRRRLS